MSLSEQELAALRAQAETLRVQAQAEGISGAAVVVAAASLVQLVDEVRRLREGDCVLTGSSEIELAHRACVERHNVEVLGPHPADDWASWLERTLWSVDGTVTFTGRDREAVGFCAVCRRNLLEPAASA